MVDDDPTQQPPSDAADPSETWRPKTPMRLDEDPLAEEEPRFNQIDLDVALECGQVVGRKHCLLDLWQLIAGWLKEEGVPTPHTNGAPPAEGDPTLFSTTQKQAADMFERTLRWVYEQNAQVDKAYEEYQEFLAD